MKWLPGQIIRIICNRCEKLIKAKMEMRNFRIKDSYEVVLASVCTECGEVCGIAPRQHLDMSDGNHPGILDDHGDDMEIL